MNKIEVNDKLMLDELYKDSALTLEGLAPTDENLQELKKWVENYTAFKREDFYIIEGSVMNREYHLTGTNAYPEENCTLVSVKLSDLERPTILSIPRFHIGGRWFDDIVDNNARREEEK
jgi:hypothetical protein